jgi:signal transduction histidine kinase
LDGLPTLRGNARQIEIALSNLVRNAIDALKGSSGKDRVIRLETHLKGRMVTVNISDNGPGISAEVLAHIFDPWFTTKGSEGTGIGLYLARQVIEAHRGTISVNSKVGEGTTFQIRLPIATEQV